MSRVNGLRLPIRSPHTVTSGWRALVRTLTSRTSSLRALVRTPNSHVAGLRQLVRNQNTRTGGVRHLIRVPTNKTSGIRYRVLGAQTRIFGIRQRIRANNTGNAALRWVVSTLPPPTITIPPAPPYTGLGILPILPGVASPFAYAVNGTPLDVQPNLCTAPISTAPIPAGTTFVLGFNNPSPMVLALFTSGTVLTLSFALSDGSIRTAQVLVTSVQTGTQLLVTVTLLQNSSSYVWVLPTQAS